jgi:hypothetical protein
MPGAMSANASSSSSASAAMRLIEAAGCGVLMISPWSTSRIA